MILSDQNSPHAGDSANLLIENHFKNSIKSREGSKSIKKIEAPVFSRRKSFQKFHQKSGR